MGRTVDVSDLIAAHEVADLLGLARREIISVYQSRYPEMPRPVIERSGGRTRLWVRQDINAWARQTGRICPPRRSPDLPKAAKSGGIASDEQPLDPIVG